MQVLAKMLMRPEHTLLVAQHMRPILIDLAARALLPESKLGTVRVRTLHTPVVRATTTQPRTRAHIHTHARTRP